jgi:MtfA peptidase
MPPDTSHIPDLTKPPPPPGDTFIDSFELQQLLLREANQRRIDSIGELYLQSKLEEEQVNPTQDWVMFLVLLFIIGLSAFLYIIRPARIEERKKRQRYDPGPLGSATKEIQYDGWLSKYNPYYNSLSPALKERFLYRTICFIQEKDFKFHSMVEEEYIVVLISGAAVQMTFGLNNYHMDYFPIIHIIRKEYVLDIDKETYYGHVSRSGIYISWNSFMEGYTDYADSVNVGLHEMAHAVSYDLFLGDQDGHDRLFKERLEEFSKEGIIVFRSMKHGGDHLLDDYALTNFDEFWAVCVETFFENAAEFQQRLPALYETLCDLLNQNPLKPEKIIDSSLAGLEI